MFQFPDTPCITNNCVDTYRKRQDFDIFDSVNAKDAKPSGLSAIILDNVHFYKSGVRVVQSGIPVTIIS